MDGRTEITTKLRSDTAVTDLVGTYNSEPAIFDVPLTPQGYDDSAISMYLTAPVVIGSKFGQYNNTINCYSTNYATASDIQDAVIMSLSREFGDNRTYYVCTKQVIIPPAETGGDYNAPVEVLVKQPL